MLWLTENLSTIIICLVLAVIVGLIIYFQVKNRKNGKCACGHDCGSCGGCCHGAEAKK